MTPLLSALGAPLPDLAARRLCLRVHALGIGQPADQGAGKLLILFHDGAHDGEGVAGAGEDAFLVLRRPRPDIGLDCSTTASRRPATRSHSSAVPLITNPPTIEYRACIGSSICGASAGRQDNRRRPCRRVALWNLK